MFELEYNPDYIEIDKTPYKDLETLRHTMWTRIMAMQVEAQNEVIQQMLDNGESIDDYSFHETYWWEDTVYHYKFWKEKK